VAPLAEGQDQRSRHDPLVLGQQDAYARHAKSNAFASNDALKSSSAFAGGGTWSEQYAGQL
jgi:hypothetical protein